MSGWHACTTTALRSVIHHDLRFFGTRVSFALCITSHHLLSTTQRRYTFHPFFVRPRLLRHQPEKACTGYRTGSIDRSQPTPLLRPPARIDERSVIPTLLPSVLSSPSLLVFDTTSLIAVSYSTAGCRTGQALESKTPTKHRQAQQSHEPNQKKKKHCISPITHTPCLLNARISSPPSSPPSANNHPPSKPPPSNNQASTQRRRLLPQPQPTTTTPAHRHLHPAQYPPPPPPLPHNITNIIIISPPAWPSTRREAHHPPAQSPSQTPRPTAAEEAIAAPKGSGTPSARISGILAAGRRRGRKSFSSLVL